MSTVMASLVTRMADIFAHGVIKDDLAIILELAQLLDDSVSPLTLPYSAPTADGAADMTKVLFILNGATTTIDLTAFTPTRIGQLAVIWCTDSTNDCTVTTGAGVTWDGTNDAATFADAGDALFVVAVSLTRWGIIANVGAVSFS